MSAQNRDIERMMNFVMGEASAMSGFPSPVPYPETPIIKNFGASVLNNITVTNSTVGVINTGSIQTVDHAVTMLNDEGFSVVADALRRLTQAVLDEPQLPSAKKKETLDLLGAISAEAVTAKEQRRPAVIRPVINELSNIMQGVVVLQTLAAKYIPIIASFFNV